MKLKMKKKSNKKHKVNCVIHSKMFLLLVLLKPLYEFKQILCILHVYHASLTLLNVLIACNDASFTDFNLTKLMRYYIFS